ncbi:hypothetical protein F4774DRAFT_419115 [Daldinia eschscholtzii]|nr:hypothetical protein F4774DRAFT_419115 [Daldinia eschscholtzii]
MNKPPIIRKPVPVRPGEAPALKEQCQDVSGIGEDLWEVARATLDEDVRSIISDEGVEPKDRIHVLKLVLHESNEKRKQCLKQRWKIRKRNGDVIILRDVFEKMIRWVDNFKDISKIVMEFAPSYASIPWGIICILLKASINDTEIFAAMIDGLEKVTCMISRYAIFEIVYFQRPAAASRELKSSLVMLYSSILTFLAHSYHYFGQRASKRFLKSVFESSASDIDDLLAKIETREREVDRVAQLVGIELLHEASDNIGSLRSTTEILSTQMALLNTQFGERGQNALSAEHVLELQQAIAASIGDSTHRIFEPIYRISDQLTVEVRRQIFDWLSSVRYKITHQVERKHRLPDSGTWMFNTPEYQSWINSSVSGTLWLHGMPGCGKTKLA